MKKLNLGCGLDYRKGWINHDFNKEVKADIYFDLNKFPYPFKNNEFDLICMDNTLEHIEQKKIIKVMEELHRILNHWGVIEIYVPHNSGMYAFSHLTHYSYYGIGTFDSFDVEESFNGERYSKAQFKIEERRLMFFHHNLQNFKFLREFPIDILFNFNRTWQMLMEKFQFLGFDEIKYVLRVIK